MCGIAGYAGLDDPALLRSMCATLVHRGPDEDGFYSAPGVGLGMRRLSVIDLLTGRQPISNESGDVCVVFNGEIYNYLALSAELKRAGHTFRTTSDTETLVHLYEDHGLDFVNRLRGMFAIALWDAKRRRLVLARDRIGEKPLFYAQHAGGLLFASEIKALLQARIPRSVNSQALCDFLAMGYVPSPHTFFAGVRKLAPGEMLIHENGSTRIVPYWRHGDRSRASGDFRQSCTELSERLQESVSLCLKSDVEVGAFLSGGIDSSVLVALMRRKETRVQTFSVGYGGRARGFNELSYARQVARLLGTTHHELILEPRSSMELLPRILWHFDEPHGEPTSVLVYLLSEFTRRKVKVALGGTGGDEIFFGYPRHAGVRMLDSYRRLPAWLRKHVVERIIARWPESTRGSRFAKRARRFIAGAGLAPNEAYAAWVRLLRPDVHERIVSKQTRALAPNPAGDEFIHRILTDPSRGELLDRVADLDVLGYLPEFQLAYVDRMSMAHGLEVRSPLCDYRLLEYVTSLPPHFRLRGTRTKHIFKEVATQWIPRRIARRKKVGFDSPIGQWAKGEMREFILEFLSPEHVNRSGLLNGDEVCRMLNEHMHGQRDHSLQIWSLLAVEGWYRMYIEDGVMDGSAYTLADMRGVPQSTRAPARPAVAASRAVDDAPRRGRPGSPYGAVRRRLWEKTPRNLRRGLRPVIHRIPPAVLLGRDFRAWREFAQATDAWTVEQSRAYQLSQVRNICGRAALHSPYYREQFKRIGFSPDDLHGIADIRRLPTIDREVLSSQLDEMVTVNPRGSGIHRASTGGSHGHPLHFYIDADRTAIEYAHLVAGWKRAGYRPDIPMAVLRGRVVSPDNGEIRHEYDPVLRHHYYSSFHMGEDDLQRYIEHLRGIGPCYLHVYPSAVATLARYIEKSNTAAPDNVLGIIAESETVYPQQRRLVERVFGRRYFSCYGHSEKLVMAAECEESTDYHVWPGYGFCELLDEDGRPVDTPGQRGEIVGTGFINRVVPFIRYRTGDYATYVGERCDACSRQHMILRDVRGHRTQEVLVAVDGSEIPWAALNMHDDTFLHVRQFQFHQAHPGRATLRIVPAAGFSTADERRIATNLRAKLDSRLEIAIERVAAIRLTRRGKATYVLQEIPDRSAAHPGPDGQPLTSPAHATDRPLPVGATTVAAVPPGVHDAARSASS